MNIRIIALVLVLEASLGLAEPSDRKSHTRKKIFVVNNAITRRRPVRRPLATRNATVRPVVVPTTMNNSIPTIPNDALYDYYFAG